MGGTECPLELLVVSNVLPSRAIRGLSVPTGRRPVRPNGVLLSTGLILDQGSRGQEI